MCGLLSFVDGKRAAPRLTRFGVEGSDMTALSDPQQLHLEAYQGFSCTLCGRCCRRPWRVVVEPEVEADVRGSAIFATREKEGYVPIEVSPEDDKLRLGRRDNGSCLFMDETTQGCELHLEVGLERKPLGCQMFPYRAVTTPTGTYIYQSWACPPVVEGCSDNTEEIKEQLGRLLQKFPSAPAELPDYEQPVRLTPDVHISWPSYLSLERRLSEGFDPEQPLSSILGMTLNVLRLAADHPQGDIETWPELGVWPDDLSFETSLLSLYASIALAVIETEHQPERREEVHEALQNGQPVASLHLGMTLPPFRIDAPTSPLFRQTFHRYVRNVLSGKLLLSPSVGARLLTVAAGYAMLWFYAEAHRQHRGEAEVTLEAITEAFDLVEQELSHYRHLECFFLDCEKTLLELVSSPV